MFGESDKDSHARLRKLEIEQPELKEGWKNDFQTALTKVDEELVEEVIRGSHNQVGKHDVKHVPEADSWDKIFVSQEFLRLFSTALTVHCRTVRPCLDRTRTQTGTATSFENSSTTFSPDGAETSTRETRP